MKKILVFTLITFFVLISVGLAAGPTGPNNPGEILGQGKLASDPHRTFRLVRWSPTAAVTHTLTADSIVIWDSTHDDGVTINVTTTSGDSRVAGVLVTAIVSGDTGLDGEINLASDDVGKVNWGWLQVYGKCNVNVASTSGISTAGYAMGTGITPGCAGVFSTDSIGQPGYLPNKVGIAGFFYDGGTEFAKYASTADQSIDCFVRCQ